MAQSTESIAHEAKGIQTALKELRQSRNPWDRDVEFQRKRLRRLYLALLLTHPYERESQDVENHLWMQTSYGLISDYKLLITASDKQPEPSNPQQPRVKNGHNVGKTIQRFRQFLAEEEQFYIQLVARCRRTFGLEEVHSALVAVHVLTADDTSSHTRPTNGRNHNQFPPEDTVIHLPRDTEQRQSRINLVSKLLICLGDIARYRELYNESGGRPKAGVEDGPPKRGGRNRKVGLAPNEILAKARNYEKALAYYEQAKSLTPNDGHAFHQLAILASYQRDLFGSLVYYYRALCAINAYEMASENMGSTFTRALTQWKAERENYTLEKIKESSVPLRIRVDIFEIQVVVLHSFWRMAPSQVDELSPRHLEDAVAMFASLVSRCVLPVELISRTIVLTQGALWKHRMPRDKSRKRSEARSRGDLSATESRIFSHLLHFHKALLDEGAKQIEELHPSDSNPGDLGQTITATFRRTLPALRIASKWLRANLKYIQGRKEGTIPYFWMSYSAFVRALARAFPLSKLPDNRAFLEEDIELRGFSPLDGFMGTQSTRDSDMVGIHPNVDQLVRIADLIRDAISLAELPNSPLASYGGHIIVMDPELEKTPPPRERPPWPDLFPGFPAQVISNSNPEPEDDSRTETTDDLVEEAFRVGLGREEAFDDDDDDEIVFNPNPAPVPITPPKVTLPTPSSPNAPMRRAQANRSPTGTTAGDLLNIIKAPIRPLSSQPQSLFIPNIWSEFVPPPSNPQPSIPQTTHAVEQFTHRSHLRRTSYDHPVNGGISNFTSLAHQLQSQHPPHSSGMSLGYSHNHLQSSPPAQSFSPGPAQHSAQYGYNNFIAPNPSSRPEYGLYSHPRHMS